MPIKNGPTHGQLITVVNFYTVLYEILIKSPNHNQHKDIVSTCTYTVSLGEVYMVFLLSLDIQSSVINYQTGRQRSNIEAEIIPRLLTILETGLIMPSLFCNTHIKWGRKFHTCLDKKLSHEKTYGYTSANWPKSSKTNAWKAKKRKSILLTFKVRHFKS